MPLHPISRRHLDKLSGELGIMQRAIGSRPDPASGYCIDDIARALEVDLLHGRVLGWPAVAESAWRNLRFLETAFDRATGTFRSFLATTGDWVAGRASQDSQGRAMLAIGATIDGAPDEVMREAAIGLWDVALPATGRLTELRAQAAVVLGCDARIGLSANEPARAMLAKFSRGIDRKFRGNASSDWFWPENDLTYENALLARCLIVAGRKLRSPDMVGTGVQTIDWLFRVQTAASGHLSPIGNGRWSRGGVRSRFDQLPIEATALLLAAEAALEATGDPRFRDLMELAYAWFLGRNDLDISVAHPTRGASSDGLTPSGRNTNEGAESTLMWHMAAEHMRSTRARAIATASTSIATPQDSRTAAPGQGPAILHLASVAR